MNINLNDDQMLIQCYLETEEGIQYLANVGIFERSISRAFLNISLLGELIDAKKLASDEDPLLQLHLNGVPVSLVSWGESSRHDDILVIDYPVFLM